RATAYAPAAAAITIAIAMLWSAATPGVAAEAPLAAATSGARAAPLAAATSGARAAPPPAAPRADAANHELDALVAEAMAHSPLIAAASARWVAAGKVPSQVGALPDPQVTMQEFTVGGPRPLEGYETSDFYYTGVGAEQDIPGPGKLRLAATAAGHDADAARHQYVARQREVAARVREGCFNLFYSAKTLALLEQSRADLLRIGHVAEAQYRLGMGRQQDVLKAQFQATAMLKDIADARGDFAAQQAALKALLGRELDSRDIWIGEIAPTTVALPADQLGAAAANGSEELKAAQSMEAKDAASLALARRGYWPDFSVGYMYQKTGPGQRDYFMLTLGAKVPLYFWRKQTPAIEQAAAEREAALSDLRATRLEAEADAQSRMLAMRTAERTMSIYRDGLIAQAEVAETSSLNDYRAGKVDFTTLLSAALDVLSARQGYWRALADHEIAAARLRQIIGEQP
ncbi:MAG TPA: TolC family protein, partial [Steroidobacteraceae bacterium]|nr:TolC family protein [Steroidobacteraceae bacterium]